MELVIPELKSRYLDFIGMYENVLPDGYCEHLIEQFNIQREKGGCGTRKRDEDSNRLMRDDTFHFMTVHDDMFVRFHDADGVYADINGALQRCFDDYADKFDIISTYDIQSRVVKMQRTDPGQGYHIWHCEHGPRPVEASRVLVWAIYLNDIEEAGETEFIYQKLRIPPKKNTALIWPAAFTHTHRGNVVYGDKSKYILTGWFNLE